MEGLKSRAVALIVCIALILVGWFGGNALENIGGGLLTTQAAGMKNNTVVLQIGDQKVTADQYLYYLAANCDSIYQYYAIGDWNQDLTEDMTVADYVRESAERNVSEAVAIRQLAAELGAAMTEEQQADIGTMDDYYTTYYGTQEVYEYMLAYAGLDRDLLRYNTEPSYLYSNLYDALLGEGGALEPTEENVAAWAERNSYTDLDAETRLAYYKDSSYGAVAEYLENYLDTMEVTRTAAYDAVDVNVFYPALLEAREALEYPVAEEDSAAE